MNKVKKYMAIMALGFAGGSMYIIPYVKYVFVDQQTAAMNITNAQAGLLITMYAIVAALVLVPGGIISDRFSPKKLMVFSLLGTTALTFLYGFTLNYKLSLIIWLGFGVSCAFVFWPALMKTVGLIGDKEEQGRMYGIYYAFNGISAALINSLSLYISRRGATPRQGFFYAVMIIAGGTLLAAILVILFLKEDKEAVANAASEAIQIKDFPKVVTRSYTWLFALVTFCTYIVYSSNTYFNPYLVNVLGADPTASGIFTIIRTYVFMLLAPLGGFLCDKIFRSTGKYFMVALSFIALFIVGFLFLPSNINPTVAGIYSLLPAAITMSVYGVQFSIQRELDIPVELLGTAIGLSSLFSWLPDIFMHTIYGSLIDRHGATGYTMIFTFAAAICIVDAITCAYIWKKAKSKREKMSKETLRVI